MALTIISSSPSSWGNIRQAINNNTSETEQRLQYLESGAVVMSGDGTPSNSLGNNNDYYIKRVDSTLWRKVDGAWQQDASLVGAVGLTYRGDWGGAIAYSIRDGVTHQGRFWYAKRANIGVTPSTIATDDWALLANNVFNRGTWASNTVYEPNDIVRYNGSAYVVLVRHTSSATTPNVATSNYSLLVDKGDAGTNAVPRGAWSSSTGYVANDLVRYNGSQWRALRSNTNVTPIEGADWTLFIQKGDTGPQGSTGLGVPAGGSAKQFLQKIDATDNNTQWVYAIEEQVMTRSGTLAVGAVAPRWYITRSIIITGISIAVNTPSAGASIIVDLNRATSGAPGTMSTLYTTQSNRPSIGASGYGLLSAALPDTVSIPAGDYLQMEVDQIGSTTPGADLTMFIRYRLT